jgi:tetratricopeptide (TPR) repeat protein
VCQAVAEYLLDCHLPGLARSALRVMAKHVKQGPEKSVFRLSSRLLAGRAAMLSEDWALAKETLAAATEIDPASPEAWTLLASLQYVQGLHKDAAQGYGLALSLLEAAGQPAPLQLYLRLGLLYLEAGEAADAREVYLRGCRAASAASGGAAGGGAAGGKQPDRRLAGVSSLWLGVGTACLRLEEFESAEQCLAEANILNNQNEKVWGYLALLCMTVSPARPAEADQALEQALRHGLQLPGLLRELGNGYVAADKLDVAEKVLRRSLAAQESNLTRARLADVLTAQNSFEAALAQYTQVLESAVDPAEKAAALEQCVDLLHTLGRAEEAKQYVAMAEA